MQAKSVAIIGTQPSLLSSPSDSLPRPKSTVQGLTNPPPGAGAAGSSTAYHLSLLTHERSIPTNITVFERSPYIGGRTTTVNAWDDASSPIELGGSIFISANRILVGAAREFNLSTSSPRAQRRKGSKIEEDGKDELGIWNGKEFVLITPDELGWWEKAKLLWRYGLAPIRTNALMKKTVDKFLRMYEEPGFPWADLGEVAAEVGLLGSTSVTGRQLLEKEGVGQRFQREIVQAR